MVIETFLYEFVITPELRLPERQNARCASRSSRAHRALRYALAGRLVAEMSCHCCGIVTPAPQATQRDALTASGTLANQVQIAIQ